MADTRAGGKRTLQGGGPFDGKLSLKGHQQQVKSGGRLLGIDEPKHPDTMIGEAPPPRPHEAYIQSLWSASKGHPVIPRQACGRLDGYVIKCRNTFCGACREFGGGSTGRRGISELSDPRYTGRAAAAGQSCVEIDATLGLPLTMPEAAAP